MTTGVRYYIVYVLLGVTALFIALHTDQAVPVRRSFDQFPAQTGAWTLVSNTVFSDDVLEALKPTDYIYSRYINRDGGVVTLYVGYHDGGKESGEIHSPKHCLPGSGWHELSSGRRQLDTGGESLNLAQAVYRKGEDSELFLYWFQVRGKTLNDEYSLKLAQITGSLLYRRRDSAFIRVSIPFSDNELSAQKLGERFIGDFLPILEEFLPR